MPGTRKKRKQSRALEALNNSPINYFSDLFVAAMVVAWIAVIVIMIFMAIFSTVRSADNSIWSDLAGLVAIPLSAGGAIWMIKNTVQHNIMNKQGKQCPYDFPAVDASEEIGGQERLLFAEEETTEAQEGGAVG